MTLHDSTFSKHGGNAASVAAYETAARAQTELCVLIHGWICAAPDGMTSKEICARLDRERPRSTGHWALNHFSGRLTDLRMAGMVRTFEQPNSKKSIRRDGAEVLYDAAEKAQRSLGFSSSVVRGVAA